MIIDEVQASEKPIILFIDDLQWSDAPTLSLIQRLVTAREMRHLFVIGAYRSNEVDVARSLGRGAAQVALAGRVGGAAGLSGSLQTHLVKGPEHAGGGTRGRHEFDHPQAGVPTGEPVGGARIYYRMEGGGGGLRSAQPDGTVTIENSSIIDNIALPGGTAGGIMVATFGAPVLVTIQDSVIPGNVDKNCQVEGDPAVAVLTLLGGNTIDDGSCAPPP